LIGATLNKNLFVAVGSADPSAFINTWQQLSY
jgi:hypothetical protein